jgi:hypothetical protein
MRERNGWVRSAICGARYAIGLSALFGRPVWSPLQSLSSDAAARKDAATELVRSFAFQRVLEDMPRRHRPPSIPLSARVSVRMHVFSLSGCPFVAGRRPTEPRMIRQSGEAAPQPSCQQS